MMSEKTYKVVRTVHFILLAVAILLDIVFLVNLPEAAPPKPGGEAGAGMTALFPVAVVELFKKIKDWTLEFGVVSSVIYLVKGGKKEAAFFYKLSVALIAASACAGAVSELGMAGFNAAFAVMIVKSALLFVLAFVPNLGVKKSWVIYALVLAADIAACFILKVPAGGLGAIAATVLRLVVTGTVGLAIVVKYNDKAQRAAV